MGFRKFLIDTTSSFFGRRAGTRVAMWFLGYDVAKDVVRRTMDAWGVDPTIIEFRVYTKIDFKNQIDVPDGVPADLSTSGGIVELPNKWEPKDWHPNDEEP